ncbi:PTS system mannose/fructose/sorbose family transporter subunit IID [Breznakia pachnodae]|uniref:Mannose/fructose/sorbose-specific phosphotransferase system IID component n=1 Tax=Breznakia pachnodae TaxID=265178 RepID=A0ABU0E0L3_9FIRM|nr:PTS system mannose/fructose/sorbose family transporter subunit IID [Breznakia pachnodae]MDQ0360263.1 mannose/fructose/sorbose-specific phosphotransferase system IID component [Breznakia pachnodae]
MTIIQEVLLGIIAVVGWCEYVDGINKSTRPLVMCTLVGLVLGDLNKGIIIGGTLELATMGMMGIGISIPINITIAGVLGAGFAISGGLTTEAAVALAIPVGIVFRLLEHVATTGYDLVAAKLLFDHPEKNTPKQVYKSFWIIFGLSCVFMFLTVFISLLVGADVVANIANSIPDNVMNAIGTGTNLLTALGFAMLFNLTMTPKTLAFFFIGFVCAAYLQMPTMAVAILGAAFAAVAFFFTKDKDMVEESGIIDFDDLEDDPQEVVEIKKLLSNSDLKSIFFKSFGLEGPFIYSRLQSIGYCRAMLPAIEKIYTDQKDQSDAINRHLEFFNSNPELSTFIMGISASMEEQNAQDKSFDASSINNVKAGLMGPIAGIGDSFWWGIVKTVAAGIGCQFAMQGSILGPILFLLVFNIPHWLIRYILTFKGYELGHKVLEMMSKSNIIEKISLCAGILGMCVIGAMTCDMISISTPLVFNMANEVTVEVQSILDEIVPNLLPLISIFVISKLLRKQVKVLPLIFALLAFGIVFNLIGVIA